MALASPLGSRPIARSSWTAAALLRVVCWSVLGASSVAHAHSPYLLPNVFDIVERKHVTVEASFTETFFVPDIAMKADDYHVVGPDGTKRSLTPVYTQDLALIEAPTLAQGTYRISTGQRSGRVAKALYRNGDYEFIEPDKPVASGERVYDVKSITTADVFVSRGKPDNAALAPRNKGLEFRPITHPNSLFAGGEAKFEVLFDGKPLPNQPISVHAGDERYSNRKIYAETRSDGAGVFTVKLDRPGLYLGMTRYRLLPAMKDEPGTSHTYAVTFEATE